MFFFITPRRVAQESCSKVWRQIQFRAFHDFVSKNGNVPIALRQWEYLGNVGNAPK